ANFLDGGAVAYVLTGGSGQNIYVYTSASDSPLAGQLNSGGQLAQTWDQITNFHLGTDKLDFRSIDGVSAFNWLGLRSAGTTSLGSAGRFGIWYTTDGAGGSFVYVDTTGDGTADLKIQLAGVQTLSRTDLLVRTGPTAVATVLALSSDSGRPGDFITNLALQTISGTYTGTLGAGQQIQVSADGGTTWVTATTSGASWSAS